MTTKSTLETICCPFCGGGNFLHWDQEIGFNTVRCASCALLYVNPRPALSSIDAAVQTGVHAADAQGLNVVSRHSPRKVNRYKTVLSRLFDDVWQSGRQIRWLDIGAGYGEVVEAIGSLAEAGSSVEGVEPMKPKAAHARARGLAVKEGYLSSFDGKVDFVSLVDVFSHIPQFDSFLRDVVQVLKPKGELFLETGNLADLSSRDEFPGELGVPDHLVFAGETHIKGFLENAGFDVLRMERIRVDGMSNFAKNIVKRILGRPVRIGRPYSSNYRQLLVRARLRELVGEGRSAK